jgi:hypothetical protein
VEREKAVVGSKMGREKATKRGLNNEGGNCRVNRWLDLLGNGYYIIMMGF